jgi:nucleoside-diphosphate-sugar epimerase
MEAASSITAIEPHDAIVIGGSGAVGRFLLRRLVAAGHSAGVLSRKDVPAWARQWSRLQWQRGALPQFALADCPPTAHLLGAGPLDVLAAACAQGLPRGLRRVVALSSLSIRWKRDSPNPAERRLVSRLLAAEQQLREVLDAAGVGLTLLRPGMIYGAGIDRSMTPLLAFARRWHTLPWPRSSRGLRCPVHADDIAAALLQCAFAPALVAPEIDLPGPQCLPFDQLIDRLLQNLEVGAHRLPLPLPAPAALLRALAAGDGRLAAVAATLLRSTWDQQADADGWQALGIAPRAFAPGRDDFEAWPD